MKDSSRLIASLLWPLVVCLGCHQVRHESSWNHLGGCDSVSLAPQDCYALSGATCTRGGLCLRSFKECPPASTCQDGACHPGPLALTIAASAREFQFERDVFESVEFTGILENTSRLPVTIPRHVRIATVRVAVDGTPQLPSLGEEDVNPSLHVAMTTLEPGARVEARWRGPGRDDVSSGRNENAVFASWAPRRGRYTVVFGFGYAGCNAGERGVFRGLVYSNPVVFDVR